MALENMNNSDNVEMPLASFENDSKNSKIMKMTVNVYLMMEIGTL